MNLRLESLFVTRLLLAWKKGARYFAEIAKGMHFFPIALIVLIGYLYSLLLQSPSPMPVYILLTVLLTWGVSATHIRTFLEEPDPVFLYPAQQHVQRYLTQILIYNTAVQLLKMMVLLTFCAKLYIARLGDPNSFLILTLCLLGLKGWNLSVHWFQLRTPEPEWAGFWLRWGTNLLIIGWLLIQGPQPLVLGLSAIWLFLILGSYRKRMNPPHMIPWERLLSLEQQQVAAYYRFASHFVDVPYRTEEVRPRKMWNWVSCILPYQSDYTYRFLYLRTFFRRKEPYGAITRLTGLAAIILAILQPDILPACILVGTVQLLVSIQLPWIMRIHRYQPWLRLYPLPRSQRRMEFIRLAFPLLGMQGTLAALPLWWGPLVWTAVVATAFAWAAAWLLSRLHLPRLLKGI
ncbi:hypothetical protein GCM10011571_20490 [Marinithermofilum abyssi]|uniref:ABC transporter permease n=1 Tax=Marinithermofilum abyssi TaxID=1571185 RepID=A0A8J2VGU2_9BACL|nr:ABC transporter permease [Marinithermofilum abyssi]GGE18499.1 hypothetical protein GCM10011571_20490 [Marinithermofilum abyssi]